MKTLKDYKADKEKYLLKIQKLNAHLQRAKKLNRLLGNKKYVVKMPGGGIINVDDTRRTKSI